MKFTKMKLQANNAVMPNYTGDFFIVIDCSADIRVELVDAAGETSFSTGRAVKLPTKFTAIRITSPVDQEVEIGYGFGSANENRMTGTIAVSNNANLDTFNVEVGVAPKLIVPANFRKSCIIYPAADIKLGGSGDAVSFPVPGGAPLSLDKSNGEVWAVAMAGTVTVAILQEVL